MLAADLDCGLLGFEACLLSCCASIEQDGSVYSPWAKGLHNDLATNLVVVVEHACVRMFACERYNARAHGKPSLTALNATEAGPLTEASAYSGLPSLFPSHRVYRVTPYPPGLYMTSGDLNAGRTLAEQMSYLLSQRLHLQTLILLRSISKMDLSIKSENSILSPLLWVTTL